MLASLISLSIFAAAVTDNVPDWKTLESYYPRPVVTDYAPRSVDQSTPELHTERIMISAPGEEKIYMILTRPVGTGKYPLILAQHGLGGNKEQLGKELGPELAKKGFAMLALDAPEHGQAVTPKAAMIFQMYMIYKNSKTPNDLAKAVAEKDADGKYATFFSSIVHGAVQHWRVALDYAQTRPDLNTEKVGYIGFSMGAIIGGVYTPIDARVKAVCLVVGGDPFLEYLKGKSVPGPEIGFRMCPSLFISHLGGRPLLMANGLKDDIIPRASTDLLFSKAQEPKEQRWFDTGHFIGNGPISECAEWLIKQVSK